MILVKVTDLEQAQHSSALRRSESQEHGADKTEGLIYGDIRTNAAFCESKEPQSLGAAGLEPAASSL